ncbi:MAG: Cof-type HAD-IIB family hydrolase [Thermotogaceae bacterium]|nr:Cof-type HAD-IIB family hydrolase [Thermotogaceae bacterium]
MGGSELIPTFEAAILDIDGTLIDDGMRFSDRTRSAIQTLSENGVTVVLCSGRMYLSMRRWAERHFDRPFHMISYNGAQIHLAGEKDPFYSRRLPFEKSLEILYTLKKAGSYRQYYWDERIFSSPPAKWAEHYALHSGVAVSVQEDLERLAEETRVEPVKILAIDIPDRIDRLQKAVVGKIAGTSVFKSFATYLDFMPGGTNKGEAIREIGLKLNFSLEKTVMLGDSENDSFGFEVVGYPIAMGNAQSILKERAAWIAPDNNREGAYWALVHAFPDLSPE